jgi:outer membrane protein assembly factor BamB
MMPRSCWLNAMMFAAMLLLAAPAWAAARFAPPGESVEAAEVLHKSVEPQLQQGRFAEASEPLDKLLAPQPGGLLVLDEGGVVSAAAWLDALPVEQRSALAAAYHGRFDARVKEAFDALKQQPPATAEQFYQLAQRYPLSSLAPGIYLEAAQRASWLGDAAAAAAFFDRAQRGGWKPEGERALLAAAARVMAGGTIGNVPAELAPRAAAAATKLRWPDPVLLDGSWYQGGPRYLPATAGGMLYFGGPKDALAVRENGEVLWRWTASNRIGDWANQVGAEGYRPALFNASGGTQVLIVRQPRSTGSDCCLRAFRASDGKLLWSSEDNPGMDHLNVAGNAAVAGRYVYAVGLQWNDELGSLVLLAFDLLDGRLIFTAPLGNLVDLNRWRPERAALEDLFQQSEPAIAGDAVYVTPKIGVAYCVGRFDGRIRWTRIYEDPAVGQVWRDPRSFAPRGGRPGRVSSVPTQRLRSCGTPCVCGNVLVIAPQDTPTTMGLDSATGRVLWSSPAYPGHALRAGTDTAAFLVSGSGVEAIDAATGKSRWRYGEAAGQSRVAGPPVLVESSLFVPTLDGLVHWLNAETGTSIAGSAKPIALKQVLAVPAAKKAMEEAGLVRR